MTTAPQQPITLLVCALGGEGGGVLTAWLVNAARKHGTEGAYLGYVVVSVFLACVVDNLVASVVGVVHVDIGS